MDQGSVIHPQGSRRRSPGPVRSPGRPAGPIGGVIAVTGAVPILLAGLIGVHHVGLPASTVLLLQCNNFDKPDTSRPCGVLPGVATGCLTPVW